MSEENAEFKQLLLSAFMKLPPSPLLQGVAAAIIVSYIEMLQTICSLTHSVAKREKLMKDGGQQLLRDLNDLADTETDAGGR